jgi:hypothetical protein
LVGNLQNFIDGQLIFVVMSLLRSIIVVSIDIEVVRLVDLAHLLAIPAISSKLMS